MVKKPKEAAFISLILYVRNHEKIIYHTLHKLWHLLEYNFEQFEIIIVNDASTDKTVDIIQEYAKIEDTKKITLISLTSKHGLESAMQAGINFSIGDFVIEVDSPELHYDEKLLYKLYEKACEGFDIVSLEPKTKKRITSSIFYGIFNYFSNIKINFKTQIAHLLTRRAINSISKIKDKTRYRKLLHIFSGYKKTRLKIRINKKIKSSYTFSEKIKMSSDILFSFTNLGMQINIYIALVFFGASVFFGGYTIHQYITHEKIIEGWTTIMLFLSFGFSGVFFILAIINKYFSITLKEIRTLQPYTIESIEKL